MKSKRFLISKICKKKKNENNNLINEDKNNEKTNNQKEQSLININEENKYKIIELLNQLNYLKKLSKKQIEIGKNIEHDIEFKNMFNQKIKNYKDKNFHKFYKIVFRKFKQVLNDKKFFELLYMKFVLGYFMKKIFRKIKLKNNNLRLKTKFLLFNFQRNIKKIKKNKNTYINLKNKSHEFIWKINFKKFKINVLSFKKYIIEKNNILQIKNQKNKFYFHKFLNLININKSKIQRIKLISNYYSKIFMINIKNNIIRKKEYRNNINNITNIFNLKRMKKFIINSKNQIIKKYKIQIYKNQISHLKKLYINHSIYKSFTKILLYSYVKRLIKENKVISEIKNNINNNELILKNYQEKLLEIKNNYRQKYNYYEYLKEQKTLYIKSNESLKNQKLNYEKNFNEKYFQNSKDISEFSEIMKENKKLLKEMELKKLESKTKYPLIFHKKTKFSLKLKK